MSIHVFALLRFTQSYVTNFTTEYLRNRTKSILNIYSEFWGVSSPLCV